jgi:ATP-binding cassette, subfamily B, multidrug efflux pump
MSNTYFHADEVKTPYWNNKIASRMLPFLKPYKLNMAAAILLIFCDTAATTSLPFFLAKAVDEGIKNTSSTLLMKYVTLYIIGHIACFLIVAMRDRLLQYTGNYMLHDMRNKLFAHIQKLPISFFDRNPVGRLVIRVTNDVTTMSELFSGTLVSVLSEIFIMLGIGSMMFYLHPMLTLLTLLTTPALVFLAYKIRSRMHEAYRLSRVRLATLNSSLAENLSGMNVIHIFNQENSRSEKFDEMNKELRDAELKSIYYNSLFVPCIRLFSSVSLAILLLYGGILTLNSAISVGVFIAFISYVQSFFEPVRHISEQLSVFQSAMASAERVFDMLDEKPETDLETGKQFEKLNSCIEFKNLSFCYNPPKKVLKNVSFKIKKGEKIAVVGHTGAGKTTISSVLKRFYDYNEGNILIDGTELKDYSKSSLRYKIGLIQQDVNIFSGSILNNIFLANNEESQEINKIKLEKIVKELEMEDLLKKLPNGIHTEIHERGKNISAGQRQLIAFSRALATDPEILILDEATSSVDSETEAVIQRAVQKLTKNRTSLVIAHRLSTIKNCDRILMLHNGSLVEEGTHEELLSNRQYYHKLYELQFAKQEQ